MLRTCNAALLSAVLGGFTVPACAANVDGTLSFPGGFLPAMTVYARDMDGSRLHSVTTHESQATFRLDLPPGRYTFFAEPSQAGAPQLYGAFTQSVACRLRNPRQPCEDDHAPVVVTVGSAGVSAAENRDAAGTTPVIADWAIPDELAAQFDQLLGNRADHSAQELGAPRFSEYPVHADLAAPAALDFSAIGADADRQLHIREALPAAPTFAGSVAVAQLACGTACTDLILVDWKTGKVQAPAALAQIQQDLPCRGDESILFRRDSRLLSVTRRRNGGIVTQYFLWKPDTGALSQTAEYQRPVERFCSLPNP